MQVSWIEAEDLQALLARIAPAAPSRPAGAIPAAPTLAVPENPFIITGLDEPVQDPFDAMEGASSFVDSQPAEQEVSPDPAAFSGAALALPPETEDIPEEPMEPAPAALPLSRIRDKLRAIRQRANDAGILARGTATKAPPPAAAPPATPPSPPPAPEAAPALPSFETPTGSRRERLSAFAAWARQPLQEDGGHLLVMTDDGELLWGGEAKAGLVLSAMMAWSANLRSSALSACGELPVMRQPLASGHQLTVIPCQTAPGTLLHVAVAAPAALPAPLALALREALVQALRGHPG